MPRDNTDHIPVDQIENPVGPGYNLAWRRKDKMRGISWNGHAHVVTWEAVPGWAPISPPGSFADLFFLRQVGPERWRVELPRAAACMRGEHDTGIELLIDIDPGETIGYFIATPTVRAAIRTWTRPGEPPIEPPPTDGKGADWPGPHTAPQLVLAAALPDLFTPGLVTEFIGRHGFHGFHVPMRWQEPTVDLIALLQLADNTADPMDFWVHLWMYGDMQHNEAPADLDNDRAHQRTVCEALAPFSNWSMGCGFDLHEWASRGEIARWVAFCTSVAPGHIYGGRARTPADDPPNDEPLPGDYAGWEHRVEIKVELNDILNQAIADSEGRPVMTEDRFRVRDGDRPKDWELPQCPPGMQVCLDRNVVGLWGYRRPGNPSRDGSLPWPNAEAIRAVLRPGEPPIEPPPGGGDGCCAEACDLGVELALLRTAMEETMADWLIDMKRIEDALMAMCDREGGSDTKPPRPPAPPEGGTAEEPTIRVLDPGFAGVQSYEIIDEREIEVFVDADKAEVVLKYGPPLEPPLDEDEWPGFKIGFMQKPNKPVALHIGSAWFVHANDDAEPAEWLRSNERERKETSFPISTLDRTPEPGDRIGIFLAGPSRHLSDPSPAMRHRTGMRLYTWKDDGKLDRIA